MSGSRSRSARRIGAAIAAGLLLSGCIPPRIETVYREAGAGTGGLRLERGGVDVPPAEGVDLEEGDVLTTGPGVHVRIAFREGHALVLPGSRVEIGSLFVWLGEVLFGGRLEAATEYFTAGVAGTRYAVRVDPEAGAHVLTVFEGRVVVRSSQARTERSVGPAEELELSPGAGSQGAHRTVVRTVSREEFNERLNRYRPYLTEPVLPDFRGMRFDAARRQLASLPLISLGQVGEQPGPPDQVGLVVGQSPPPGSEAHEVTLRLGSRGVQVPEVVGQSSDAAASRLAQLGLRLAVEEAEVTGRQPGTVLAQRPAARGWVAPGGTVAVTVEGESLAVPDLVGRSPDEALSVVQRLGLRLATDERLDRRAERARIVQQDPPPQARIAPGEAIRVEVVAPARTVPQVVGMEARAAGRAIAEAGLQVGETGRPNGVFTDPGPGLILRVRRQSPRGRTQVRIGTEVDLVLETVERSGPTPEP
ncbi:MAG: PASTA domain-containing protein [Sandaracinaceae bacterium]